MKKFLVYGSYGYTGKLIVEQAVKEGLQPILAGRDEKQLRELHIRLRTPDLTKAG